MRDLRFNRRRKNGVHVYLDFFDSSKRRTGTRKYTGYLKCKLAHGLGYSIILPDQIFLDLGGRIQWIQPLYFFGNIIQQFDDFIACRIVVDVSHGQKLSIEFRSDSIVNRLADGSFLYSCVISAPDLLHRYTTGPARLIEGKPFVWLLHHTSRSAKRAILAGGHFRTSAWNIQGTKKCFNASFLYLTPLERLCCPSDLQQIAMSTNGKIAFRLDQNPTDRPDLILPVYRESTANRTHTISAWVNAEDLAPQPCFRHHPAKDYPYHEVVSPFIQRIASAPGARVEIRNRRLHPEVPKVLTHAIVGDATTVEGLAAPFDEEQTAEILKVEYIDEPNDILSFWMSHGNQDHYSLQPTELLAFK